MNHMRQNSVRTTNYFLQKFHDLKNDPEFAERFDKKSSLKLLNTVIDRISPATNFFTDLNVEKSVGVGLTEKDDEGGQEMKKREKNKGNIINNLNMG